MPLREQEKAQHGKACSCPGCTPETVATANDTQSTSGGIPAVPRSNRRGTNEATQTARSSDASVAAEPVSRDTHHISPIVSSLVEKVESRYSYTSPIQADRGGIEVKASGSRLINTGSEASISKSTEPEQRNWLNSNSESTSCPFGPTDKTISYAGDRTLNAFAYQPDLVSISRTQSVQTVTQSAQLGLSSIPSLAAAIRETPATLNEPKRIDPNPRSASEATKFTEQTSRSLATKNSSPLYTSTYPNQRSAFSNTNAVGSPAISARADTQRSDPIRQNGAVKPSSRLAITEHKASANTQRQERFIGWASERPTKDTARILKEAQPLTSQHSSRLIKSDISSNNTTRLTGASTRAPEPPLTSSRTVNQGLVESSRRQFQAGQQSSELTNGRTRASIHPQGQLASRSVNYQPRRAAPNRENVDILSNRRSDIASSTPISRDRHTIPTRQSPPQRRESVKSEESGISRRYHNAQLKESRAIKGSERPADRSSVRSATIRHKTKELQSQKDADLRELIVARLNRVVANAIRARRSDSSSITAMRQLDLATRVLEALSEEEYDGISEFRASERTGSSRIRLATSRRKKRENSVDNKKPKLKGLKALKKRAKRGPTGGPSGSATTQSTAAAGASPVAAKTSASGKISNASNRSPGKSLDIFQAKSEDAPYTDDDYLIPEEG
jgi:hypothetical protein